MIEYRVELDDLNTHQFRVSLRVPRPAAEVVLALPVWIPGSYMVRDFARHLSGLQAWQGDQACAVEALDKSRWRVRCQGRGALQLQWRVYAFDTSVRSAWLDDARGFFNGTSLLLRVEGREDEPQRLRLGRLPRGWQVATAMPVAAGGGWQAADYDALVDHPFELGPFWRGQFETGGVPHALVVSGAWPHADLARLQDDAQHICRTVQAFWQPADGPGAPAAAAPPPPPPFDRYVFLLNLVDKGYGGLEHRASTALLAQRRDLPATGAAGGEGYTTLLGLVCHEYFHAWHVKRLRPAELVRIDYQRENHTPLLWCFEGFTSYYEDLLLRRATRVDATGYLRLLARLVNTARAWPGHRLHSLAEASFEAWTKYYQRDENTPNITTSYYAHGALVALALDLSLRQRGQSLDALLRLLWQRHAAPTVAPAATARTAPEGLAAGQPDPTGGITEADIRQALRDLLPRGPARTLDAQLTRWVHGKEMPPLAELLRGHGVQWREEAPGAPGAPQPGLAARWGIKLSEGPVSGVQVQQVLAGSIAAAAGVCAGDELLAVDDWRIRRLDEALAWTTADQACTLLLVRDQRVRRLVLTAASASAEAPARWPLPSVTLALDAAPGAVALQRRRDWIDA